MSKDRFSLLSKSKEGGSGSYDAVIALLPLAKKNWKAAMPKSFTGSERSAMEQLVSRGKLDYAAGKSLIFHKSPLQIWIFVISDEKADTFSLLGTAKDMLKPLKAAQAARILLDLQECDGERGGAPFVDAFVSALKAFEFKAPRYSKKAEEGKVDFLPDLDILVKDGSIKTLQKVLDRSLAAAEGGNTVRELAMQAGNDLNPKAYVERLKAMAKQEKLGFAFFDIEKLKKWGAGAFLAVAQGSSHADSGIVKLSYEPTKKAKKHLCLVGKGVTFDTGGTNLKSAASMFSMHRDMTGSAVAFALIRMAARMEWPIQVTAYLAIADNATGSRAYRPNDVVTAMNGRTIEVVHTDAEGRMLLADTLYLASKDKPDLLVDFATLTGACVHAIGTNYAGAFTNRSDLHADIIKSGQESGERVWPFPLDEDYGECLKSDIADTKQCRLTGGVDHIEAAIFLKAFLAHDIPWVHIDLSSADQSGGLAHVDTEVTGFGVRFTEKLLQNLGF